MKKVQITTYLTPEQHMAMKQLNARTHIPQAEYIRHGIDLVLEREEPLHFKMEEQFRRAWRRQFLGVLRARMLKKNLTTKG